MERRFSIGPEMAISEVESPGPGTFNSEEELAAVTQEWSLRRLVELWNALPGVTPVRRFENRAIAIARIWRSLVGEVSKRARRAHSSRYKHVSPPRDGSKAALVLGLIQRPQGATLQEIMDATHWRSHSVRGFISGNLGKKRKLKVRLVDEGDRRFYRLPGTAH